MFHKKDCLAMLLAGGQGSRLGVLTRKIAKPAVPFGGKYRIIDFTLSNCVNSGIDTVGVLTQYQPLELNSYIGNGQPWDLDRLDGGVHILPPYQRSAGADWYKGTANAIYQNIDFIDRYHPDDVLILSGDHIYKMDYSKMVEFHHRKGADCTIAVLEVELGEAHRFGIMNTREDDSIYEFEEKPAHPKSTKASMGVYVFRWEVLRRYLIEDEADSASSNDFGKNIIPKMLQDGRAMFAFPFSGYWKDVGTIESLWDANMDLLNPSLKLDLADPNWRIYSRSPLEPPHYIGEQADVHDCIIGGGCEINGAVNFSVLFDDVKVGDGATVEYSILMPGVQIAPGAVVRYAILGEGVQVHAGAHIGSAPTDAAVPAQWGVAVVGDNLSIGDNAVVPAAAMIGADVPERAQAI